MAAGANIFEFVSEGGSLASKDSGTSWLLYDADLVHNFLAETDKSWNSQDKAFLKSKIDAIKTRINHNLPQSLDIAAPHYP
jgi:hypothetical protein